MFKIRDKILVTFLPVVIIPLIIIGAFFGIYMTKALRRDRIVEFQQSTESKVDKAIHFMRSIENDIISLRNNVFVLNLIEAIKNKDAEQMNRCKYEVEILFRTLSESNGIYDSIYFIDESGQEIVTASLGRERAYVDRPEQRQDNSHSNHFNEALELKEGGQYVSRFLLYRKRGKIGSHNELALRYAIPVFDKEKQNKGVIALDVHAESLLMNIFADKYKRGVDSYLLDRDGSYLLHPDIIKKWSGWNGFGTGKNLENDFPQEISSLFLSGQSGGLLIDKQFYSFIPIHFDSLNNEKYWILLQSFPKLIAYSQIYTFYIMLGILALLLITGVVISSFVFSGKLTNPLNELVKGVTTIAESNLDDLDYHIKVTSKDEIAFLTFSFNKMLYKLGKARKQIQNHVDNLEEKVKDKTKEIVGKARQQEIVAEIGKLLWADLDIKDIMKQVVDLVSMTLKVEFCEILLLDRSQKFLRMVNGVGWKDGVVGNVNISVGSGSQADYTLKEQKPIVIRDSRTETRFSYPAVLRDHGVVSGLSVPMIAGGHAVGVMGVHTTQEKQFSKADINFLESVGHLIAAVIGRRRAEKKITKGKEYILKLNNAIEQTAEAVAMTDKDGVVEYVNPAFEKITGYSASEVLGHNPRVLKSGKHPDGFYKEMWKTINEGRIWQGNIINKKKDGTVYDEEMTISPVKNESGSITNFVAIKRDVTLQNEINRQLIVKTKELENVNKEIEEFVYIVSHDLKEPLFAIEGYRSRLSKVYKDTFDNKGKLYVDRIKVNVEKMSQKINEVMEVIKVGKVTYNIKNNDSSVIVKDVVNMLEGKIEKNNIKLSIQDNLPTVICDRKRLKDLFSNLLANAIKFIGDDNQRQIKIGCNTNGRYCEFFVEDTGIGIRKEYQKQIFKIFNRLRDIETEGMGVGLAIVKKIVELHNGKIWVESPIYFDQVYGGNGSRFCFTLPVSSKRS